MIRSARNPRYRAVYRELRARILSGQYAPGARIETEPELTQQFDVSIITIRQAEGMLEEEGLLDRQQGRGTFVPESVRRRLKVQCVIGLNLAEGLQHSMGSYFSDLILLSEREAARRGMEFEAVWLDAGDPERVKPYRSPDALREYWGTMFIACQPDHPLLEQVRGLGLRYVLISSRAGTDQRQVWLDYPAAIRMGLDVFNDGSAPPLVMGIDTLRQDVESALAETGRDARQVYLQGVDKVGGYDTAGYLRTLELHKEGASLTRILLLDDIVAQGVTRALLKLGYGEDDVKLAIICGKQEIIPLGLPATYVVHDTAEEARHAFEILDAPPGKRDKPLSRRSGFVLLARQS